MNPILIKIGPISIYWYSVCILLAALIGGYLFLKETKKFKMNEDKIVNMLFYLVPICLVGARLYFVLFNLEYYLSNPIEIVKVWEGGLAIHGGIIAGIIFVIYYTKKHKLNTFKIFDIASISLLIGQAIGRWGNFFNSEAYGPETTYHFLEKIKIPEFIIEGMYINGKYHHPTFLYESVWCIIGCITLLVLKKSKKIKNGQLFSIYLTWYGIGRFLIESLRTDSLMFGNLKIAQLVSIVMILVGIILFIMLQLKEKRTYNEKVK